MADDATSLDHLIGADDLRDGAALQSTEDNPEIDRLPRVLRYALRAAAGERGTKSRLAADIVEAAPDLEEQARAWLVDPTLSQTLELAAGLDRLSVEKDSPPLRGLADSVRVVALPIPSPERDGAADYLRAMQALKLARDACPGLTDEIQAKVDRVLLGWAAAPLVVASDSHAGRRPAIAIGADLVEDMTSSIVNAAVASDRLRSVERNGVPSHAERGADEAPCPPDHVIVCRRDVPVSAAGRATDAARAHAHVINAPAPLIACPDLGLLRRALVAEYPYAAEAVDFCLGGLMNRPFVHFEPALIVGAPGCGKTRFVRRLAEVLHVGLWRVDATQADGSAIAGTDRRWSTAAPCAPFLAISRHRHANPIVLVDELEKAATRADYGRLWDSLIALCERENTRAYPDPALGAPVDISWVSFLATANSTTAIPAPLLDRFRVVDFGSPRLEDLDVLAEAFRLDLARDRRTDSRFIDPLSPKERSMLARQWRGGSARRLRRMLDVIWRARDKNSSRH